MFSLSCIVLKAARVTCPPKVVVAVVFRTIAPPLINILLLGRGDEVPALRLATLHLCSVGGFASFMGDELSKG